MFAYLVAYTHTLSYRVRTLTIGIALATVSRRIDIVGVSIWSP